MPDAEPLPGGLQLRTVRADELDQVAALLGERGEPVDGADFRLMVDDPDYGTEACAVVVDGERVVSTLFLLDEEVTLGHPGVTLPAGQVDLVATDLEYEGRGLVRALMEWAHRRSARRGHVVQVMLGIPYFYRRFGYSYAIDIPRAYVVPQPPSAPPGHLVRTAEAGDIRALAAMQDRTQDRADLRMPHSVASWRWLLAAEGSTTWVVERAGRPVATGRADPARGRAAADRGRRRRRGRGPGVAGPRRAVGCRRRGADAGRAADPARSGATCSTGSAHRRRGRARSSTTCGSPTP